MNKGTTDLWQSIKKSLKDPEEWFFWVCFLWTTTYIIMAYVDLFCNSLQITSNMTLYYLGFISVYVANKEIRKWRANTVVIEKPGELFVLAWAITFLVAVITEFFFQTNHTIPEQLPQIVGGILTIFVGGSVAKNVREKWSKKNKSMDKGS